MFINYEIIFPSLGTFGVIHRIRPLETIPDL